MSEDHDFAPHVSIVVFSRDSKDSLVRCLTSIARLEYPNITVFLADNGSTSYDPHAVESLFEGLILLENEGYPNPAQGRNAALARILRMRRTEFVLLLDEGTIVHPRMVRMLVDAHDTQRGWDVLQPSVYELESPETLYGYGGTVNLYTGRVSLNRRLPRALDPADEAATIDVAFSYAMFTHRSVFDTVGTFDELLFPEDSDDADFCMRAPRRNHGVAVLPGAIVWLADRPAAAAQDSFLKGRSRSLLVRRFGRLHHKACYLVLSPLLGAGAVVGQALRGHPMSGVAGAMGMLRGLTMSMRYPEPPAEPDEPEADEWRSDPLPHKGHKPASPR